MIATHLGTLAHRCHCSHPDTTTYCVLEGESKHSVCSDCDYIEAEDRQKLILNYKDTWKFVTTSQLAADSLKLCRHVPINCKGIIGVARSGLIPAAIISTHLHLPLFSVSKETGLIKLGTGTREYLVPYQSEFVKSGHNSDYFLVDDSVFNGNTMWLTRGILEGLNFVTAAVYVKPESMSVVDFAAESWEAPHFFEWNLFNSGFMAPWPDEGYNGIAIDFDGILCDDPQPGADRSPDLEWLKNLQPHYYMPRYTKVEEIITNRLEKWRPETEDWLRRHGLGWKKLIMSPHETVEERDANFPQEIVQHKGRVYKESECMLYIESDPMQAELIFEFTQKPVLCPAIARIFQ